MNRLAREVNSQTSIRATAEEARRASSWMERWCQDHQVPPNVIGRLDICLNEALANVIAHGGPAAVAAPVLLEMGIERDAAQPEISLCIQDEGCAFNPLQAAPVARPQSLQSAEPGGLGIVMMMDAASRIEYQRLEGCNQVTFVVQWKNNT